MPTLQGTVTLRSLTVSGFRGIGAESRLDFPAGPGLTLVMGRNGAGKSSFAEALEMLLTGDTHRWRTRSQVWSQNWRNLHHAGPVKLEAEFDILGQAPVKVGRRWAERASLKNGENSGGTAASLGWTEALQKHRPILSQNELGTTLDEGPTRLYDTVSSVLGLEPLVQAQAILRSQRLLHESDAREMKTKLTALRALLVASKDDRA